ncbi:hypothetical protein NLJ89_g10156 [Agrocybe chaxingu]|uniref:Uncharacterized protein n=1 Tax=Agrocybe chaxingu TaxID=84603 RepID=A0A9W8JRA7_9AGAR|nr:hypothetical protein NLJ89_g10156 [Agrocybe chaxingu]
MFGRFSKFAAIAAMVAISSALPHDLSTFTARTEKNKSPLSFDSWNGISSLSGFDDFYGSDNYSGKVSSVTIIEQESQLVCHTQKIEIIQQRLLILQEMAKKIITETICEVETQTIVFQQFHESIGHFGGDIRHKSSKGAGYDKSIASQYSNIVNSDGSLNTTDLGFSGKDNGNNYVVPTGSNWNNQTSPASVDAAYNATKSAM